MATTLLLDRDTNDLCLDSAGDIALASEPYSLVQDVTTEARVWLGEVYYDTTYGVPYAQIFAGNVPNISVQSVLEEAAKRVPGVTVATVLLNEITDRELTGQIQIPEGTITL